MEKEWDWLRFALVYALDQAKKELITVLTRKSLRPSREETAEVS